MDKRIAYGLSYDEAVKKVLEEVGDKATHINFSTPRHEVVWAELRTDGWRVYSNMDGKKGP